MIMEELNTGLIVVACLILLLTLVGNVALGVVVFRQLSRRQTAKNYLYLVLNLALCDVMLALSSIPFDITQRYTQPVFPFGATMCKMLWPFQTICSMASIFTVGALSFQRYRFIVHPWKGKWSNRTFFALLGSVWLLPVLLAGVPYASVLRLDTNSSQCIEDWRPVNQQAKIKLSFTIYLFIIQYVLPLALIVWCNVQAIRALKSYKHRRRSSMLSSQPFEFHANAVKMLIAIVAVFALFWLPGQLMAFMLEFQPNNMFIVKYGLDIGYIFVFANCVANPVIFAYYGNNNRDKMVALLKRAISRQKERCRSSLTQCDVSVGQLCSEPTDNYSDDAFMETGNNSVMRTFLELLKTMNKERLKVLLDGTRETVLY